MDVRSDMAKMLMQNKAKPALTKHTQLHSAGGATIPRHSASIIPTLVATKNLILQELEQNIFKLISLNESRRTAVSEYLERLSGRGFGANLRAWIDGPRSPSQNAAIQAYFEEIALVFLGQAMLLKSWSDRGVRRWSRDDLGKINWTMITALKPMLPYDREGWNVTRQNMYSWYIPSNHIQSEIWSRLELFRLSDEDASFVVTVLEAAKQANPDAYVPRGYDQRFFKVIWDNACALGLQLTSRDELLKRQRTAFSPTLRDGALVRTAPESLSWAGLEVSPYYLLVCEIAHLWLGPISPPLWAAGSGLEVHARDQLSLNLFSSRPSLLLKISELEAFDAGFVLEEQVVRANTRTADAQRFRDLMDSMPYYKNFKKTSGVSMGALQVCVALTKMRPGGLMWWAREEPLSTADGSEVLSLILDRARVVCEWDFSDIKQALPQSMPLYSKYLYLFSREADVERRLANRPIRVAVSGEIRSHVEMPLMLEDGFIAAVNSLDEASSRNDEQKVFRVRGNWDIRVNRSVTCQSEWNDKWPDPSCHDVIRFLDKLRAASKPLANVATVSAVSSNKGSDNSDGLITGGTPVHGVLIEADSDNKAGRTLIVSSLVDLKKLDGVSARHGSPRFVVMLPDESWIAPVSAYLRSDTVRKWLEQNVERRSERWLLTEQAVKWIPIPQFLLQAIGSARTLSLTPEWDALLSEIDLRPGKVKENVDRLDSSDESIKIKSAVFVRASRVLGQLSSGHDRLRSLVSPDGKVRWRGIFDILPKAEFVAVSFHPKLRLSGNLPAHIPISRIDQVKAPSQGIMLSTEIGLNLTMLSESSLVLQMLLEQLEGITHPTWSELVQYLRLPRRIEFAESTASDILKLHEEQSTRIKELLELLSACMLF